MSIINDIKKYKHYTRKVSGRTYMDIKEIKVEKVREVNACSQWEVGEVLSIRQHYQNGGQYYIELAGWIKGFRSRLSPTCSYCAEFFDLSTNKFKTEYFEGTISYEKVNLFNNRDYYHRIGINPIVLFIMKLWETRKQKRLERKVSKLYKLFDEDGHLNMGSDVVKDYLQDRLAGAIEEMTVEEYAIEVYEDEEDECNCSKCKRSRRCKIN